MQLKGLKCDKAPCPDGISPWILKMLHLEISPILTDDLPIITCPSHVTVEMERSPWSFQERKKRGTQKLQTNFSYLYLLQNPRKHCSLSYYGLFRV